MELRAAATTARRIHQFGLRLDLRNPPADVELSPLGGRALLDSRLAGLVACPANEHADRRTALRAIFRSSIISAGRQGRSACLRFGAPRAPRRAGSNLIASTSAKNFCRLDYRNYQDVQIGDSAILTVSGHTALGDKGLRTSAFNALAVSPSGVSGRMFDC